MDHGLSQERVAETVRTLREAKGLSVRTLAASAGFSPSFISQVENGQASPSISSLERIASVLGVTLAEFFSDSAPTPAKVVRASGRQELTSQWSRAQLEALGPVGASHKLESVMLTLEPGGLSGKHPATYGRETFVMVFEGEVTLTMGSEEHQLRRGDAVTLPPDMVHRWENPSSAPVRLIMVSAR